MLKKLKESKGLQLSLITITSGMIASGFAAIAIILISRLLGPSDFAYFSAAFSLSLILNRLNDFGLVTVIQKYVGGEFRKKKINKYLSLCLRYRLIISVIITSVGLIFSPNIADFLNIENTWLIPIVFITSLAPTYFESSQATLQSLGQFKFAAYNYVVPAVIKLAMGIIVFAFRITNVQLILAIYLLSTLPSLLIAEFGKKDWIKYDLENKFPKEKAKILELLKHSAFAIIAAGLIENVDLLFAKHYLTDFETGLLGGVNRISMLLYVVAYSLANVLNPRVAKYTQKKNMDAFIKKSWSIVALSVLGFFVLTPISPYLIKYSIGPDYLTGTGILNVLLASGFISIAMMPFIATFYAFKNNSYFSWAAILQLIIVFVGNIYFVPLYGLTATAWTRLISRAALMLFTIIAFLLNYRKEFKK